MILKACLNELRGISDLNLKRVQPHWWVSKHISLHFKTSQFFRLHKVRCRWRWNNFGVTFCNLIGFNLFKKGSDGLEKQKEIIQKTESNWSCAFFFLSSFEQRKKNQSFHLQQERFLGCPRLKNPVKIANDKNLKINSTFWILRSPGF